MTVGTGQKAARIGAAVGVVGAGVGTFAAGTAEAGDAVVPRCIDVPPPETSTEWGYEEWNTYFETCDADFGWGKLIVNVVVEEEPGVFVPAPSGVDLDTIVDAFDFGYADPTRDADKSMLDPYCDLEWENYGWDLIAGEAFDDFRMDEDVAGRRVRVLQLLGDRDPATGAGAVEYGLHPNQLIFTWFCNADTDQLRMLPVADVGAGYQLEAYVNETFTAYNMDQFDDPITEIDVVITQQPPATTTTTTTVTPTTEATTTVAPTSVAPSPPTPTTVTAILPPTGDSNGWTAAIAAVAVALGSAALWVSRRRPA